MHPSTLATALSLALTGLTLSAAPAFATEPSASGSGVVSIQNMVKGSFVVGSNGSAYSYAENREAAKATVTASTDKTSNYGTVNAAISGDTTTSSYGKAYNLSSGTGSGSATSTGTATAGVQGSAAIHGVTDGHTGGHAGTTSSNQIVAGTNQGSFVQGTTESGFAVQVHYSRSTDSTAAPAGTTGGTRSATVEVTDQKTGYAGGNTFTGVLQTMTAANVLQDMNAAGIAAIGASGTFFAKAGLAATTGSVSAH